MRSAEGFRRRVECRRLRCVVRRRRVARAAKIGLRRREWRRRLRRGFAATARRDRRLEVDLRRRLAAIFFPFLFATTIRLGLWTRTNLGI